MYVCDQNIPGQLPPSRESQLLGTGEALPVEEEEVSPPEGDREKERNPEEIKNLNKKRRLVERTGRVKNKMNIVKQGSIETEQ